MNGQHPAVALTSQVTALLDDAGDLNIDLRPGLIKSSRVLSDVVFSVNRMDGQHPAVALTSQVTALLDDAGELNLDLHPGLIKVVAGSVGRGV